LSEIAWHGPIEELTRTANCQPALYVHGLACLAAILFIRSMLYKAALRAVAPNLQRSYWMATRSPIYSHQCQCALWLIGHIHDVGLRIEHVVIGEVGAMVTRASVEPFGNATIPCVASPAADLPFGQRRRPSPLFQSSLNATRSSPPYLLTMDLDITFIILNITCRENLNQNRSELSATCRTERGSNPSKRDRTFCRIL
jgi:hypothetical protein